MEQKELWQIQYGDSREKREKSIPALTCVGNGRIGIRGAFPELANRGDRGIFMAGFYDQLPRPELYPQRFNPFLVSWSHMNLVPGYHREVCIVKCPDFLDCTWDLGDELLDPGTYVRESLNQTLSMKTGEISLRLGFCTPGGKKFVLEQRRFADMKADNRIFQKYTLTSVNFSGEVCYRYGIDGDTKNFNISGIYQDTTDGTDEEYIRLYDVVRQKNLDGGGVAMLVRGRVDGHKAAFATCVAEPGAVATGGEGRYEFALEPGESVSFTRVATFENDTFCADPYAASCSALERARSSSYEDAFRESCGVWSALWDRSDIVIEGDDKIQLGLRHSIYELLIAACRSSSLVSIPAKGLTGEGYRGMVFWDTDIHTSPFFLYTQPEIARNLVEFRVRTLQGAKEKARRYGQIGASYPWETGCSGREECEEFLKLLTHQLHITADVAYTAGRYLQTSEDCGFWEDALAELFLETARFWLSKGYEKDGFFCIPDASGPDELHLECENSAYVNHLAAHNLQLAARTVDHLRKAAPQKLQSLMEKTGVTEEELSAIDRYRSRMKTMQAEDGVFEQCEGFFGLEDRIVFEDSLYDIPADTQTVKQADVLMLLYLLPELTTKKTLLANWNYYEPRTTHTSSLSYGVHGILASQLGLMEKAVYYLEKSMGIDLYDETDGCGEGVHLAADGMSWSAVVSGMCGCSLNGEELEINPALPEGWSQIAFTLVWKRRILKLQIQHHTLRVTLERGEPLTAVLCGKGYELREGTAQWLSY